MFDTAVDVPPFIVILAAPCNTLMVDSQGKLEMAEWQQTEMVVRGGLVAYRCCYDNVVDGCHPSMYRLVESVLTSILRTGLIIC